jgi:hypothetical protein
VISKAFDTHSLTANSSAHLKHSFRFRTVNDVYICPFSLAPLPVDDCTPAPKAYLKRLRPFTVTTTWIIRSYPHFHRIWLPKGRSAQVVDEPACRKNTIRNHICLREFQKVGMHFTQPTTRCSGRLYGSQTYSFMAVGLGGSQIVLRLWYQQILYVSSNGYLHSCK